MDRGLQESGEEGVKGGDKLRFPQSWETLGGSVADTTDHAPDTVTPRNVWIILEEPCWVHYKQVNESSHVRSRRRLGSSVDMNANIHWFLQANQMDTHASGPLLTFCKRIIITHNPEDSPPHQSRGLVLSQEQPALMTVPVCP